MQPTCCGDAHSLPSCRLSPAPLMDEEEEEKLPVVPLGDRKLRACLVTGLVKTEDQVRAPFDLPDHPRRRRSHACHLRPAQWVKEGNDNVPCLDCVNDREMVFEITSMNFDGCGCRAAPSLCPSAVPRRGGLLTAAASPRRMVAMMQPNNSWVARWQSICAHSLPSSHVSLGRTADRRLPRAVRSQLRAGLLRAVGQGRPAAQPHCHARGQRHSVPPAGRQPVTMVQGAASPSEPHAPPG